MKNIYFIIAGLLLLIWAISVWGFHSIGPVHILLALAGFIIIYRLYFNKQLSRK